MYLIIKEYLYEGSGNFGRADAMHRQVRIPDGKPATVGKYLQKAKDVFKETWGHYPFVDYTVIDSSDPVDAMKVVVK